MMYHSELFAKGTLVNASVTGIVNLLLCNGGAVHNGLASFMGPSCRFPTSICSRICSKQNTSLLVLKEIDFTTKVCLNLPGTKWRPRMFLLGE